LLRGEPRAREHAALRWLPAEELFDVPWIPVDLELVRQVSHELAT
jgi:8-oxo-dGTP diphosphatase